MKTIEKENSKSILEFLFSQDYNCYWHVSNLYKTNNHKNNIINVFNQNYVCVNVLAIPNEKNVVIDLEKIESTDSWFK